MLHCLLSSYRPNCDSWWKSVAQCREKKKQLKAWTKWNSWPGNKTRDPAYCGGNKLKPMINTVSTVRHEGVGNRPQTCAHYITAWEKACITDHELSSFRRLWSNQSVFILAPLAWYILELVNKDLLRRRPNCPWRFSYALYPASLHLWSYLHVNIVSAHFLHQRQVCIWEPRTLLPNQVLNDKIEQSKDIRIYRWGTQRGI